MGAVVAFVADALLETIANRLLFGTYPWEPVNPELVAYMLRDPTTTIVPAFIVSALLRFGALLLGGYLVGWRAGYRGGTHGLVVAGVFLLLTVVEGTVLLGIRTGFDPAGEVASADIGLASINPVAFLVFPIAFVVSLLLPFLGGYLGGKVGERRATSEEPG